MTPVDQLRHHNPEDGSYGDCMRACIASLLDRRSSEVPHFFDYDQRARGAGPGIEAMNEWLQALGWGYIEIFVAHPFHPTVVRNYLRGFHVMLGLSPRGVPHAVIGRGGVLFHDPSPSRLGITPIRSLDDPQGPEGFYLGFLCMV